jgi:hypothetical protein
MTTPGAASLTVSRMRTLAMFAVMVGATVARAQPADWRDAPATLAAVVAPIDDELRACLTAPGPRTVAIVFTRGDDGATRAALPMPPVGIRGLTPEERCLLAVVPRVVAPPLPALIERIAFAYVIGGPAAVDPDPASWRDPGTVIADVIDPARASLAACAARARMVRLVFDRRRARTRVWLPAWQFHSRRGDGTTPPRERRVKACVRRAIRGWQLPPLPPAMGELHVAVDVAP